MTVIDSSVLIDYLDGKDSTVQYVQDRVDEVALAPPLVLFEVYQGEVYKTGPADFEAVELALSWVSVARTTADTARAAAELQVELRSRGQPLSARDAFVAGVASTLDERLAVADSEFDVPGLTEYLEVDFV